MRLLVIACSARKIAVAKPTAALQVYDGPLYRAIRRRRADGSFPPDIAIRIVSAKYGLLKEDTRIRTYDKRLDPRRDERLLTHARRDLTNVIAEVKPISVCISMGRDYALALPSLDQVAALLVEGPPGSRVRQVLQWSAGS